MVDWLSVEVNSYTICLTIFQQYNDDNCLFIKSDKGSWRYQNNQVTYFDNQADYVFKKVFLVNDSSKFWRKVKSMDNCI